MAGPILIFGGTFNPVHFGHLIVARSVAEQLGAQKITLMPAHLPPHKASVSAEPQHRLAMLRLAVAGDELFDVSTLELDRGGPSYTYETLQSLRQVHGPQTDLCWLIGLDMLHDLASWYRAAELLGLARIVTAVRPPMPEDLPARLERLRPAFTREQVGQLAQDVLPTPLVDISSTDIRRRVREGLPIRYLTAEGVVTYIQEHGLYRT